MLCVSSSDGSSIGKDFISIIFIGHRLHAPLLAAILDDVIESGRSHILKRSAVLCGMSFITFNRDMVIGTQRNAPIQKDRVSNKRDLHYIHPSSIIGLKTVTGLFITFERVGNTIQKECVNALPTPVPIQKDCFSTKEG